METYRYEAGRKRIGKKSGNLIGRDFIRVACFGGFSVFQEAGTNQNTFRDPGTFSIRY